METGSSSQTIAEQLRAGLEQLTPSERTLANRLLDDYPMAGMVTIVELATSAGISTPTVLRMLKKLGYSGFPEFQRQLKQELSATLADPIARNSQWASDIPEEHLLSRFSAAAFQNLQQSLKQVDHNTFDSVAVLLADLDRNIYTVGGRITHPFAEYLKTHLQIIRENVETLPASQTLWPHHLLNMKPGDVLLIFDIRRYEQSLRELSRLADQREVEIVLFTDPWLSPISRRATHYFSARTDAPSSWDSGLVTLFLLEALIAAVENNLGKHGSERIGELERIFDKTGRYR